MAVFEFKKIEEKILAFWDQHEIFKKSLAQRERAKRFVFFEGPPTANGNPHMGHFEGRVFKDLFARYKTMRGFYVLRKAGWDTHGLPVELEVEKQLGFKNKKDIEEYGIAAFNKKAKESVWKYKSQWEAMTRRMAFWVDLDHPYVTYEAPYIESLWAIFKKIWDKKLLYQAHRVVPFCTRCGTPLSFHEVAQGYQKVTDHSVYVKFALRRDPARPYTLAPKTSILAWTTTPWTLPGNVALAVGETIDYIVAKVGTEQFIVAKELAQKVIGKEFETVTELKGSDLVGLEYEPLFSIPALKSETSYKIYAAPFVATTEGTGVVHTAVMYGEDDYALGTHVGLPKVHTVDERGKFIGVNPELDGKYVKAKETEDLIIGHLRDHDTIFRIEDCEHDYPFCWRCGTALLYYAKTSWFIRMSALKDQLVKNNSKVNWIPEHIKEGRFGQWIKEGKDWTISRERYWGTPLPIWKCIKCENHTCIGSYAELEHDAASSGNTYYVMRHGYSMRNEKTEMVISSNLDSDTYHLTDEGHAQVTAAVEQFKVLEEGVDVIYTSPFLRTKETAEIAAKLLHRDVQIDDRLVEIRHGPVCESRPHGVCPTKSGRKSFDQSDDGGENYNDVRRRLMEFMREIESKYRGKKILIVGHGDPLWLLSTIGGGFTDREILARQSVSGEWYPNFAEIKKITWRTIPRNDVGELDPHRPYVDEMQIKCHHCGATMHRIPDLADVWFDSGAMPYAQWHWPFENQEMIDSPSLKLRRAQQFPADFIVEAIDQTRGWFYTLLAVATLLDRGAPYKNVMSLGHVLDEKGQKLSKSKGNYVAPDSVMDAYGVDTARWYFYTINAPGEPKLFSEKDVKERLAGFMATLQNCVRFYELYILESQKSNVETKKLHLLDTWVFSRWHGLVKETTAQLDQYDPVTAARAIERFVVDDFSQWWLRRSRRRMEALPVLRTILLELAKLLAPFIPYTVEDIHMRLHTYQAPGAESIHLHDWPVSDRKQINLKLEAEMERVRTTVAHGLAIRKEKNIKVRQPLHTMTVIGKKFDADLETLIKDELNVRKVLYAKSGKLALDLEIDADLRAEGYMRECMRQIQDMRKEVGYRFDQKVYCQWHSDDTELSEAILHWAETIKTEAVLSDLVNQARGKQKYDVQKGFTITPGRTIWIGIRK